MKNTKYSTDQFKLEFLDLKYLLFRELRGITHPPLTENHSAQKPLAELRGAPSSPLTEKIC